MKHEKTFEAIGKLKEIEVELHRLKNALEMANRGLDAKREWAGLTDEEVGYIADDYSNVTSAVRAAEAQLKEKNT